MNEATKLATEEAQEEAKEGMEDGTRIGRSRACMKCRCFPAELAAFFEIVGTTFDYLMYIKHMDDEL